MAYNWGRGAHVSGEACKWRFTVLVLWQMNHMFNRKLTKDNNVPKHTYFTHIAYTQVSFPTPTYCRIPQNLVWEHKSNNILTKPFLCFIKLLLRIPEGVWRICRLHSPELPYATHWRWQLSPTPSPTDASKFHQHGKVGCNGSCFTWRKTPDLGDSQY